MQNRPSIERDRLGAGGLLISSLKSSCLISSCILSLAYLVTPAVVNKLLHSHERISLRVGRKGALRRASKLIRKPRPISIPPVACMGVRVPFRSCEIGRYIRYGRDRTP